MEIDTFYWYNKFTVIQYIHVEDRGSRLNLHSQGGYVTFELTAYSLSSTFLQMEIYM